MYHFADLVISNEIDEELKPDIPECVISYHARYPESLESTWCFCDSVFATDDIDSLKLEKASNELTLLLDSAKQYAPAFALAFPQVNAIWPQTKQEYENNLIHALRDQLQNQNTNGFFLSESKVDDADYLSRGEFVWIVKFIPEINEVIWVSSDYELFQDSVLKFNLDESSLNKLHSIQIKSLTSC